MSQISSTSFDHCKKAVTGIFDMLSEVSKFVPDLFPEEERQSEYEKILERGKRLALAERSIESTKLSVNELISRSATLNDSSRESLGELFDSIYEGHAATADHTKSDRFRRLVATIHALSGDNAIAAANFGDDDVITTQAAINTIDPISKQQMEDPVKGKNCGHSYERNSIVDMIRQKHGPRGLRCPYVGCHERLTLRDLVDDDELREYIRRQAK